MSHNWYPNKETFEAATNATVNKSLIISQDTNANGGKEFISIYPQQVLQIANKYNNYNLYEVIPTKTDYKVYLYMDIDGQEKDNPENNTLAPILLDNFLTHFHTFLGIAGEPILGQDYQIATASDHTKKISFHLKYNIIFEHSIDILERVIKPFIAFYPEADAYLDKGVYSKYRSYRMLYSTKFACNNPLVPYKTASVHIKDHMVSVLEAFPQCELALASIFPEPVEAIPKSVRHSTTAKTIIDTTFPHRIIEAVKECILDHYPEEVIVFKSIKQLEEQKVAYNIDYEKCDFVCPIAKETHKDSSNLLSSFYYNNRKQTIKYRCCHELCFQHKDRDAYNFNVDIARRDFEIVWSEVQPTPTEFPYPAPKESDNGTILAIKGPMGCGKTKALLEYFATYCAEDVITFKPRVDAFEGYFPNEKAVVEKDEKIVTPKYSALVITYSRVLAAKYHESFAPFGFQHYKDKQWGSPRFIVCLDSLVNMVKFTWDFVFIDEMLSVMLHYNSGVMNNNQKVCTFFEKIMTNAKHIVAMDACIDSPIVSNVLNYFWQKELTWIKYTYMHPTNRKTTLTFNNNVKQSKNMKMTVLERIYRLVSNENKKVVVCSNTKKFTDEVKTFLNMRDKTVRVMVYNVDTNNTIVAKHSRDPHNAWVDYDVIVYSPTITAGVSFELDYFDHLVAYFKNNDKCSKVDLALQQLYRVRKLGNGQMDIYIEMTSKYCVDAEHPIEDSDIDSYLETNANKINEHFEFDIPFEIINDKKFKYNIYSLSYRLLKGIIMNTNDSLVNFLEIMLNTLKNDYQIETKVKCFKVSDKEHIVKVLKLFADHQKTLNAEIAWSPSLISSDEERDAISQKVELDNTEKMILWIDKVANDIWGISTSRIDEEFYTKYINIKNHRDAFELFAQTKRFAEFMSETNVNFNFTSRAHDVINYMTNDSNYDIPLFKSRIRTYYDKIKYGKELLDVIFSVTKGGIKITKNYKSIFNDNKIIIIGTDVVERRLKRYIQAMGEKTLKTVVNTFGLKEEQYYITDTKMWGPRKCTGFISSVLQKAFGLSYTTGINTHNDREVTGTKEFMAYDLNAMMEKYTPSKLIMKKKEPNAKLQDFAFIDTDK